MKVEVGSGREGGEKGVREREREREIRSVCVVQPVRPSVGQSKGRKEEGEGKEGKGK